MSAPSFNNNPKGSNNESELEGAWEGAVRRLVGMLALHTRGMRSPYTGGTLSLHGGFDFPTRENDFPFAGAMGNNDARGTTFPLVVDEVVSKQLFKAHTAELLPGGDYKLVVKSRAGDAGGPLQTSFRKVKYLHVVDPAPASLAQTSDGKCKIMSFTDNGGATNFSFGDDWTLTGEGLYGNGAPEGEWSFDYATFHVAAEDLTFQGTFEEDGSSATLTPLPDQHITPGVYENVAFNYRVVRDGVTETLTLTIPTLTVT